MESKSHKTPGCVTILTLALLLTSLFFALKVTGAVSWPWAAVLSPLMAYAVFTLLVFLIGVAALWHNRRRHP